MNPSSAWFTSNKILKEHLDLPVRQIYLWFITSDNKLPIVAGSNNNFQLPGGKPEKDECFRETIKRELFEETGIIIEDEMVLNMFGYYLVKNDSNWDLKPYL